MTKTEQIINFLDQEIEKLGLEFLTPPQANKILFEQGLLSDSARKPGLPLRNLLKEGFLPHAYQVGDKWRIPHSAKGGTEKESKNVEIINKKGNKSTQKIDTKGWVVIGAAVIMFLFLIRVIFVNGKTSDTKIASTDFSASYIMSDTSTKNGYVKNVYYKNNGIASKGKLVNNLKDSVWSYYAESGYMTEQINYKEGKITGKTIKYSENGKILETYSYSDDVLNGEFIRYYDDGKTIKEKGKFKDNKLSGVFEKYFENGFLEQRYTYKNGLKEGKYEGFDYIEYNKRHYLKNTGYYESDQKDGEWKYYDYYYDIKTQKLGDKLILIATDNFKEDKLNGKSIDYEPQYGFKLVEANYVNDIENGIRKSYCPHGVDAGKLYIVEEYRNGELVDKLPYQCRCPYPNLLNQ